MKVATEYLTFHTKTRRAYIHLTPQVEEVVHKSGVKEGMVLVSAMHITAGVYVNDNESCLSQTSMSGLKQFRARRILTINTTRRVKTMATLT